MPHTHPSITSLLGLSTLTLATVRADGRPHAAPVYFVADQEQPLRLYFFSSTDSQHSQDTAQNMKAAAAIYPEGWGWEDIRGLQLSGQVRPVPRGPEWDRIWELYREKFPFVSVLEDEVGQNQLYVFQASWLRLVDNRKGFGYNQEWELG
jgi:uncharacterized protein YhbP (UPF0306 family)